MLLLARGLDEGVVVLPVDEEGAPTAPEVFVTWEGWPAEVARRELEHPRWVWHDTRSWYPALLAAGVRVARAYDLRLAQAILGRSERVPRSVRPSADLEAAEVADDAGATLAGWREGTVDLDVAAAYRRQAAALRASADPGALRLLLAAESAGALIAEEMRHAGLPWRRDVHERLLHRVLGPRPAPGQRPARLEQVLAEFRSALGDPAADPDSPGALLPRLRAAGIEVNSTRQWELAQVEHPAIEPLLRYKKLARLLTANGWHWLDTWVRGDRFRPVYVVGGVVTGRWAAAGGGALQLPKQVREAVVADAGWTFVVADAAQLEPRVLAALAGDARLAAAGRGADLYDGIVAAGGAPDRGHAKAGMLGALYGGTTGESARVLPRLARAFPDALALVEAAARAGESGAAVTTRLGRSTPPETAPAATDASRRARGRFTRNFVVQGSAAEWALCWLAATRRGLAELPETTTSGAAPAPFARRAHLVFFLHDEIVVHAPREQADHITTVIRDAAAEAGRLLFGTTAVDFPLSVAVVDDYARAEEFESAEERDGDRPLVPPANLHDNARGSVSPAQREPGSLHTE